jgi:hypothetical protein
LEAAPFDGIDRVMSDGGDIEVLPIFARGPTKKR